MNRQDAQYRQRLFSTNPLPGAVVDTDSWMLMNSEAFWPGFSTADLRQDFVIVTRMLEGMKTKFDQTVYRLILVSERVQHCYQCESLKSRFLTQRHSSKRGGGCCTFSWSPLSSSVVDTCKSECL